MNKNLKMNAEIRFEFTQPLSEQTALSFDIGTIEFTINHKCVPIEFDHIDHTADLDGNTASVTLTAGYGAYDYKNSSRGESEKANREPKPTADDITSKHISSATQINIFDLWPMLDDEEVDADDFKMTILSISFSDSFGSHAIGCGPITAFNEAFNKV